MGLIRLSEEAFSFKRYMELITEAQEREKNQVMNEIEEI